MHICEYRVFFHFVDMLPPSQVTEFCSHYKMRMALQRIFHSTQKQNFSHNKVLNTRVIFLNNRTYTGRSINLVPYHGRARKCISYKSMRMKMD